MGIEQFGPLGGGSGGGGGSRVVGDSITTTTGTYKDITGLPADVVYVSISIGGLRHNSTGNEKYQMTLGLASGYTNAGTNNDPEISGDLASSASLNKLIVLRKVSKTSNKWRFWSDNGGNVLLNQDSVLNGPLERIRIGLHSVSGTERFNGGEINYQYVTQSGAVGGTSTTNVPEGTNQYFTQARARASLTGGGIIDFNRTTGVFSTNTANLATAVDAILVGGTDISVEKSGNTITVAYTGEGGNNVSAFNPSPGTSALASSAQFAVKVGNTWETRTKRFMESDIFPVHLKDLALAGYNFNTGALNTMVAGDVKILTTVTNNVITALTILVWARNADDRRDIVEILNEDFLIGIADGDTALNGIVQRKAAAIPGANTNIVGAVMLTNSIPNLGTVVSGLSGAVTFRSSGRAMKWNDLTQTISKDEAHRLLIPSSKAVADALPVKASKQEVQQGENDSKFITSKLLALSEAQIQEPMNWSGFSWQNTEPDGNTANRVGEDDNIDYLYQFVTTQAIAEAMDSRFNQNDFIEITHDSSNRITGRVDYADARALGSNWVFEVKVRDEGIDEDGSFSAGDSITLTHKSRLATDILDNLTGTVSEAQEANATDIIATLKSIRDYVGWESGEQTWTGFRTTTDTTPAAGTWRMYDASSPYVRTFDYRPHSKAEADAILHKSAGDAYIQVYQSATIFRQIYAPSVTAVEVEASDIPIIRALAIVEFGTGTFTANTDSSLTLLGSIRSLSARTHDFKDVKGNNQVTMDTTFRNFPRRAGTTEHEEDWLMEVYAVSMTSVINTRMAGVTGWNASGNKGGNARVQWRVRSPGSNSWGSWQDSPEFTDIYNSNITANLPIAKGYQIRPGHVGPVQIRWQIRRKSDSANWWVDSSEAFASVA